MSLELDSSSPKTLVNALRQVLNQEEMTGVAVQIVALAGHASDEVRMWAVEAMERSVKPVPSEIDALTKQLQQSDDGEVCYWAATMLGRLEVDAAPAAQALCDCLENSLYLPARERAAWALCQIGDAAVVAEASLKKAAQEAPPRLKRIATEALKRMNQAA